MAGLRKRVETEVVADGNGEEAARAAVNHAVNHAGKGRNGTPITVILRVLHGEYH
jgi:hypothetical protein